MFVINITEVPEAATDFAFDHLEDDIENSDCLATDYDAQRVTVDSGNMRFAFEVRVAVIERIQECLQEMLNVGQDGIDVRATLYEVDSASEDLHNRVVVDVV